MVEVAGIDQGAGDAVGPCLGVRDDDRDRDILTRMSEDGMDFADALHLAGAAAGRCQAVLSFDARFARAAKGRTACVVVRPR